MWHDACNEHGMSNRLSPRRRKAASRKVAAIVSANLSEGTVPVHSFAKVAALSAVLARDVSEAAKFKTAQVPQGAVFSARHVGKPIFGELARELVFFPPDALHPHGSMKVLSRDVAPAPRRYARFART